MDLTKTINHGTITVATPHGEVAVALSRSDGFVGAPIANCLAYLSVYGIDVIVRGQCDPLEGSPLFLPLDISRYGRSFNPVPLSTQEKVRGIIREAVSFALEDVDVAALIDIGARSAAREHHRASRTPSLDLEIIDKIAEWAQMLARHETVRRVAEGGALVAVTPAEVKERVAAELQKTLQFALEPQRAYALCSAEDLSVSLVLADSRDEALDLWRADGHAEDEVAWVRDPS